MESVLAIWHAMSLGEGRPDARQGFRVPRPHTKLLLPFVRGSKESSGEVTPYCRCWYCGPAADPREQLLRWPARWKPSSVVVFLYTGLSKFMLCTDRLRKYR